MGNQLSIDEEQVPLPNIAAEDPVDAAFELYESKLMEERGAREDTLDACEYRNLKRHEVVLQLAKKPEQNVQLLKQAKDARKLMGAFQHYDESDATDSAVGASPIKEVASMTFGDVLVPGVFISKDKAVDPNALLRKYLLLKDTSDPNDVWRLLTRTWKLPYPNLVISLISGEVDPDSGIKEQINQLHPFLAKTGTWILSDGMHKGASLLLSKTIGFGQETGDSINEDFNELTLIGITQWHDLGSDDKKLLYGMSLERFYDSYYFYPKQDDLHKGEVDGMANPYQNAYLFESTSDGKRGSLREKLIDFLRKKHPFGELKMSKDKNVYDGAAFMPTVSYVVGGNVCEEFLSQLKSSVQCSLPVIIAPRSGDGPAKVFDIYQQLEIVKRRCTLHEPDFTEEEEEKLREILSDSQEYYNEWKTIMKFRYYLTFLGSDVNETITEFIIGVLKGKKHNQCMSTALLTGSHDFLKATLIREIDPAFDHDSSHVNMEELKKLHVLNFSQESRMRSVLFDDMQTEVTDKNSLQFAGMIIFKMLGWQYLIQYHDEARLRSQLRDNKTQVWNLFLFAILSNKSLEIIEFLASITKSPLGAVIFAHRLLKAMSLRARYWLEDDLGDVFETKSEHFIQLAEKMLNKMYTANKKSAYKSLNRELPFNLGSHVTALSLAIDSNAKQFLCSPCCQTYISGVVWFGPVHPSLWRRIVAVMFPVFGWPFLPKIKVDDDTEGPCCIKQSRSAPTKCQENCCFYPLCKCSVIGCRNLGLFYSAPATKFIFDLAMFVAFLAVFSCFLLIDLMPISSVSDVTPIEWLTYSFVLGKILEEFVQIFIASESPLKSVKLGRGLWSLPDRILLKTKLFNLKFYFSQGAWNTLDFAMLVLFIVSTVCRFTVSFNYFQIVRIMFSVTILLAYTRSLRYFYVFEQVGPRVIAITLMLTELAKMCLVLIVFIFSFGVAFQAVLNPGQQASWEVLVDLLYRPYWQMYGELFLDDASSEMGRDVGNYSCTYLKENGYPELHCFPSFPYILIAVYLIVSNVLLLNLVIAIFGNTLSEVETKAKIHWAFQQCVLAKEYYYSSWVPTPLNILWYLVLGLYRLIQRIKRKVCKKPKPESFDAFRLQTLEGVDNLQFWSYTKVS